MYGDQSPNCCETSTPSTPKGWEGLTGEPTQYIGDIYCCPENKIKMGVALTASLALSLSLYREGILFFLFFLSHVFLSYLYISFFFLLYISLETCTQYRVDIYHSMNLDIYGRSKYGLTKLPLALTTLISRRLDITWGA